MNDNQYVAFSCDFCGANKQKIHKQFTHRLELESSPFKVVRCRCCRLVRLAPTPTPEQFAEIYQNYSTERGRVEFESQRIERVYQQRLVNIRQFTAGNRLLDVGAGLGTFVHCARAAGFDAVGLEYEAEQCERAKERFGLELVNDSIENAAASLGEFDVVVMHHVLEHVISPKQILRLTHGLLSVGGVAIIEVPNQFFQIHNEWKYKLLRRYPVPDNRFHHLTFFSMRSFEKYLRQAGFELLRLTQFRTAERVGSFHKWARRFADWSRFGLGTAFEGTVRRNSE